MTLLLAALLVVVQSLTGAYWWTLARPRSRLLERAGMGMGLGTVLAVLSGVALFGVLPLGWAVFLPTIGAAVTWAARALMRRRPPSARPARARTGARGAALALAAGLTLGIGALWINLRNYPLAWTGVIDSYHGDFLFFEALSTSLATLGSGDSIFMAGAELRYHWMAYAWAGQLAELAGTEPFAVLTRLLPLTCLVASLLLVIAWTQRLTRVVWAPALAAVLLVSGGYVGATYGTILNFDSPSQQVATVWMLAAALALWQASRARSGRALVSSARGWVLLVAIAALAAGAAAGKASVALVLIGGWALVPLVAFVRRDRWAWPSLIGLVATILGAGIATIAFVSGSQGGGGIVVGSLLDKASSVQGLNPASAGWGIIAGTLLLGLAVSFRWAGLIWLIADRGSRWSAATVFGGGMGAIGILALLALSAGINDTWFPLAASAPLSVLSALGVARAVERVTPGRAWLPARPVVAAAALGVLASLGVLWVWSLAPGSSLALRWLGPLLGLASALLIAVALAPSARLHGRRAVRVGALAVVALVSLSAFGRVMGVWSGQFGVMPAQGLPASEFRPLQSVVDSMDEQRVTSWSDRQVAAAQWLRDHVQPGQLIATNVTFSPFVPALTGTPSYISGINYQAPYGRPGIREKLLAREALSWAFAQEPTAESARLLCSAGVRYVWLDPRRGVAASWEPWAETITSGEDVVVLRLAADACPG